MQRPPRDLRRQQCHVGLSRNPLGKIGDDNAMVLEDSDQLATRSPQNRHDHPPRYRQTAEDTDPLDPTAEVPASQSELRHLNLDPRREGAVT